jgi:hypothetical protein
MLVFFKTGTKTGISNLRNANPKRTRDMAKAEHEPKGEVLFKKKENKEKGKRMICVL